ncbi:MAG: malate dehydrogenase (quinone) [Oceanospirillaceae bacterium]|uniref:malate dehydrogenase (quinone) n=1 Tax=unclassified Thalassolituus TaxID=2624967 RepID=UPI000C3CAAC9|nr:MULTISPECIES: malate dehydrogenase (quinone) [unclassified Thalassolituus]MAS24452.1 malate dehydrogenase (quinone) [Oceanospirillaceae bacterium]MBS54110.1 malate dehydrogenase (quinone) [Oceanospirillaceae bacterium]|tara:strand:- start:180 stop:1658 length:1479 start_codon:yes stop_codon:yes gene_type:complete
MTIQKVDVLLVGGGVMSATLGTLLTKLDPSLNITMVERLDHVAHESTDGWNNAGTGHAGYCELNYTPEDAQGNVTIDRALTINANFEVSLQLWSHMVEKGALPEPSNFINSTPHMSFVWGDANVAFLRQRHEKMSAHHQFREMEFSEDPEVLKEWMPLVMAGRDSSEKVAATRVMHGADVDYGSLTRHLVKRMTEKENFSLLLEHQVEDFKHEKDGSWTITIEDRKTGKDKVINAGFVFLGAGGGALPLLQASDIDEAKGYGGFPVSGQWLVCKNPEIVKQHHAKVYGKAAIGAPPMSVPHLDTRIINGEPALLFGPYAGFTTKFLKEGSKMDLIKSVSATNLIPMMSVGIHNMDLTKYLISEVMQSHSDRVETLRGYFPECKDSDWTLAEAGQRVQVIKKDAKGKGKLEFGTEMVAAKDGTLAALLGASPGASVAAKAMLEVLERCFPEQMKNGWAATLKEIIPSYGEDLTKNEELLLSIRERTLSTLNLK